MTRIDTEARYTAPRSAGDAWDSYVGDQTPAEFMEYSDAEGPEAAVREYADGHAFFVGLTEDQVGEVIDLLVEHIEAEGAE